MQIPILKSRVIWRLRDSESALKFTPSRGSSGSSVNPKDYQPTPEPVNTSSHCFLTSSAPLTPSHLPRSSLTSSHSLSASLFLSRTTISLILVGASNTHLTVSLALSCSFALLSLDLLLSLPLFSASFFNPSVRSVKLTDNVDAVSAICEIAGDRVEVVGARGSIEVRMRRMVSVAEMSFE